MSRRYFSATLDPGLSEPGGSTALQIFTDQVTLSQPGGQIMPTTLLLAPPPRFSDLPTALNLAAMVHHS